MTPPVFSGGPAASERASHAAKKPCRMNNQFATSTAARQQRSGRRARGREVLDSKDLARSFYERRNRLRCGAMNLIVSQRDNGVDAQGATSGNGAGQKGNNQEHRRHGKKDQRINGVDAVK